MTNKKQNKKSLNTLNYIYPYEKDRKPKGIYAKLYEEIFQEKISFG
jgi:hypothetical protein